MKRLILIAVVLTFSTAQPALAQGILTRILGRGCSNGQCNNQQQVTPTNPQPPLVRIPAPPLTSITGNSRDDRDDRIDDLIARIKSLEKMVREVSTEKPVAGKDGKDGRDGKDAPSAEEIAASVMSALRPQIEMLVVQAVQANMPSSPTTPTESHVVVVADEGADYWSRMRDEIERAKGYFSGIKVAPPPSFSVPLPQIVVYTGGIPTYRSIGTRNVSNDLQQIAHGNFSPVSIP